jgi:D-glycero-D-manno-heptose 1,7-bisphosphate phosphatase
LPLIILDRDGVINEDSDAYIKSVSEWHPIAGSIEAIAKLSRAGYSVVIATNQSGINRGFFSLDELNAMHNKMRELVEVAGGSIDGIYFCPHRPEEGCTCRKPATGLLDAISEDWGNIEGVAFIGDSLKDLLLAEKKHCQPILVQTGKGRKTQSQLENTDLNLSQLRIFADLAAAVTSILANNTKA